MDFLRVGNPRPRSAGFVEGGVGSRRPVSRNRQWVADQGTSRPSSNASSDNERWERGGHRGGRGRVSIRGASRGFTTSRVPVSNETTPEPLNGVHEEADGTADDEPDLPTPEDRERFYQELVKAREAERKRAIAEGKMDDPLVPKRLEDAITVVGTCMDMCPRFERYRRERENNLFEWETIPGTKRVDHKKAVKMYERAAGDKVLPSDLRPPPVLKRTLDYLFHDLIGENGFARTFNFVRDRSRAVRNDFTMQHETGPLAIECHDRCARFHILSLHLERSRRDFSYQMEEQQLMNTLQSLKEFYEDQRGRYESPHELEMRVYHRLIHIRDQKERHEDIPAHMSEHPVFKLTTKFRLHVQMKSAPISKTSALVVDAEGMQIFGELAGVLREQGSVVMIYLVACILERLFGPETVDDIDSIRGNLSIPDLIDGISEPLADTTQINEVGLNGYEDHTDSEMVDELEDEEIVELDVEIDDGASPGAPSPFVPSSAEWVSKTSWDTRPSYPSSFTPSHNVFSKLSKDAGSSTASLPSTSAFSTLSTVPNAFGTSVFGASTFSPAPANSTPKSVFGLPTETLKPNLVNSGSSSKYSSAVLANQHENTFSQNGTDMPFNSPASTSVNGTDYSTTPLVNGTASKSKSPPPDLNTPLFSHTPPSPARTTNPTKPPVTPFTPTFNPPNDPARNLTNDTTSSSGPSSSLKPHNLFNSQEGSSGPLSLPSFSPSLTPPTRTLSEGAKTSPLLLPKLDTSTASKLSPTVSFSTPREPPELRRPAPISLPSTPTLPPLSMQPNKTALNNFKNLQRSATSESPSGILSPLNFASPSASMSNVLQQASPLNGQSPSKGKGRESVINSAVDYLNSEKDRESKALEFTRRGLLVKDCFEHWRHRTTDRAAWLEACRQGEAYRRKVRIQESLLDKRRRSVESLPLDTPLKKRARRRISGGYQPPRTDENLARQFKENHEENERRWAPGSFLDAIRKVVYSRAHRYPPGWRIWLSMNPDNDGTAIWMERKFDVPCSGQWESDSIFSIPLASSDNSKFASPGVIVFECTPLEGVTDDLERKFRILEDCSRLRDVTKALPPNRHFVPSLLVVSWSEATFLPGPSDFLDMISKMEEGNITNDHKIFFLTSTTKDLDSKFSGAVESMTLDYEGKLVQSLTVHGIFKLFDPAWAAFMTDWVEDQFSGQEANWTLYGRVLEDCVASLNKMAYIVLSAMSIKAPFEALSHFDPADVDDQDTAVEATIFWLKTLGDAASSILKILQSHVLEDEDIPTRTLLDQLRDFVEWRVLAFVRADQTSTFPLPRTIIASATKEFEDHIQSQNSQLQLAQTFSMRRSPKRRSMSEVSDVSGFSYPTKKMRFSQSSVATNDSPTSSPENSPQINGRHTSTPSISASEKSNVVTASMLRALTRDMKARYRTSS